MTPTNQDRPNEAEVTQNEDSSTIQLRPIDTERGQGSIWQRTVPRLTATGETRPALLTRLVDIPADLEAEISAEEAQPGEVPFHWCEVPRWLLPVWYFVREGSEEEDRAALETLALTDAEGEFIPRIWRGPDGEIQSLLDLFGCGCLYEVYAIHKGG